MKEEEISELYIRLAFQYESATELARQYSAESPGYIIQSWMRNHNT